MTCGHGAMTLQPSSGRRSGDLRSWIQNAQLRHWVHLAVSGLWMTMRPNGPACGGALLVDVHRVID